MFDAIAFLELAPAGARRFVHRVAAGQGLVGRVADVLRFRLGSAEPPRLPQRVEAPVRLFLGPVNSAGQGFRWARAVEQHLAGVSAVAMRGTGSNPFLPEVDLDVPVAVYQRSPVWHSRLEEHLEQQTHVIWESGLPLLGRRYGSEALREIRRFREAGVGAALLFHGSDIRPPAQHAAQHRWSPFRDRSGPRLALAETASRNASLVGAAGVPVFVSTPDLLEWVPDATWIPVVVDPLQWASSAQPDESRTKPVVVHAPTQRWLKGTDLIEPMLRRLSADGIIDYRQITGIPHSAMPEFYGTADIVLDQFRLGSYGVAACEALAAGRLVMGHVDAATRALVRSLTGRELPIHEATVESLEAELRRAAADPAEFAALRIAGPEFVGAVHDGRRSAAALAPFLGLSA